MFSFLSFLWTLFFLINWKSFLTFLHHRGDYLLQDGVGTFCASEHWPERFNVLLTHVLKCWQTIKSTIWSTDFLKPCLAHGKRVWLACPRAQRSAWQRDVAVRMLQLSLSIHCHGFLEGKHTHLCSDTLMQLHILQYIFQHQGGNRSHSHIFFKITIRMAKNRNFPWAPLHILTISCVHSQE